MTYYIRSPNATRAGVHEGRRVANIKIGALTEGNYACKCLDCGGEFLASTRKVGTWVSHRVARIECGLCKRG